MTRLDSNDRQHLEAAEAWLHLGNHLEADGELDEINAASRAHPDVLRIRWEIYSKAKRWEGALDIANAILTLEPTRIKNWLQKAQTLKELGHHSGACGIIRTARSAHTWSVDDLYELATEAAKLGDSLESLECLKAGSGKAGFKELKALALETDLFKEVHPQIRSL